MKYSVTLRNAQNDLITSQLGSGSTLKFYTGSPPATPLTAVTGTLLADCTFSTAAFSASASGVLTAATITGDTLINNNGTVGYARAATSGGTGVIDFTVGTSRTCT